MPTNKEIEAALECMTEIALHTDIKYRIAKAALEAAEKVRRDYVPNIIDISEPLLQERELLEILVSLEREYKKKMRAVYCAFK